MSKEPKNPKQRVVIEYKFDNPAVKDHKEGFFCKSIVKAIKAIGKRRSVNITKATFFNAAGAPIPLVEKGNKEIVGEL